MKEADIKFGVVYAIKDPDGGSPRSATVLEKCPVRPGQKRSRTYRVQYSNSPYQDDVDASAILELWSEHEKTLDHAIKILNSTKNEAERKVSIEWNKWRENLEFYLESRFPQYGTYIRPILLTSPSLDVTAETVLQEGIDKMLNNSTVSLPIKDFIELLGDDEALMYPPTDAFEAAYETYQQSVETVETQIVIPRAVKIIKNILAGDTDTADLDALRIGVDAARNDNPEATEVLLGLLVAAEANDVPVAVGIMERHLSSVLSGDPLLEHKIRSSV